VALGNRSENRSHNGTRYMQKDPMDAQTEPELERQALEAWVSQRSSYLHMSKSDLMSMDHT